MKDSLPSLSLSTICIDEDKETGTVERKSTPLIQKEGRRRGECVCANIVFIFPPRATEEMELRPR